jgi:hypothetical protein
VTEKRNINLRYITFTILDDGTVYEASDFKCDVPSEEHYSYSRIPAGVAKIANVCR